MASKSRTVGFVIAVVAFLSACGPSGMWSSYDATFKVSTLTQDPGDGFTLGWNATTATATVTAAATNTAGNSRGLFWPANQTATLDGETCARWSSEDGGTATTGNIQEGAALRVRVNADGTTDALTVTKNVWASAVYIFNTHTWHADGTQNTQLTLIGQKNLANVFDTSGDPAAPNPLPWHLCAETSGTQLRFEAWREDETRPAYGDTTHGDDVNVPAPYVYAGAFGWYAGHLQASQSVTFDQLATTALP